MFFSRFTYTITIAPLLVMTTGDWETLVESFASLYESMCNEKACHEGGYSENQQYPKWDVTKMLAQEVP